MSQTRVYRANHILIEYIKYLFMSVLLFVSMRVPFPQLPGSRGKRSQTRFRAPRREGAVSPSIARRRRRAPPAGEHRAPASTARKRGNLGRQKLTSIESRFRRMPAPAAVPQPSTTRQRGRRRQGQMRAPFFRAEAPACLPACTPPCLHALPPRARTPDLRRGPATPRVPCSAQLERRECCADRARTGRAGAGGGPAQANFSARRHGARRSWSRGSCRQRELLFYASTDCLRCDLSVW